MYNNIDSIDVIDSYFFTYPNKDKMSLYTTYALSWFYNDIFHIEDIVANKINPFKKIKIDVWWEGDRESANRTGLHLHIMSNCDLILLIYHKTYSSCSTQCLRQIERVYNVEIIDEHNLVFYRPPQYFNECNHHIYRSTTYIFLETLVYKNLTAALAASVYKLYQRYNSFFTNLNNKAKKILQKSYDLKTNQLLKTKNLSFFNGKYVSSYDVKDCARLKKIILIGKRVKVKYFDKFKEECQKLKVDYWGFNIYPFYKTCIEVIKLLDYKEINKFLLLINSYNHHKSLRYRNEYFDNYFKKQLNYGRKRSQTSHSV